MRLLVAALAIGCSAPSTPPRTAVANTVRAREPFHLMFTRGTMPCDAVSIAGPVATGCGLLFDTATGAYLGRTQRSLAALPDGRLIAAPPSGGLDITRAHHVAGGLVEYLAVSPSGDRVAYLEELFEPAFHEVLVVRETATWTTVFSQPVLRDPGDSFDQTLGFTPANAVLLTISAPSCLGRAVCVDAVLAEATATGIAMGPHGAHAGRKFAFAPDGTAIAIATATHVHVLAGNGEPIASLDLAAAELDPHLVWRLAVAPLGDTLALKIFDHHGVVLFARDGKGYRLAGGFPLLHSTQLVFDRTGDTLVTGGDGLGVLRRSASEPAIPRGPTYPIRSAGFTVDDDCDDPRSTLDCPVRHDLRARLHSEADHAMVTVYASPRAEISSSGDVATWARTIRERFGYAAEDLGRADLGLESWQAKDGRALEFRVQLRDTCTPADRFVRIEERERWLWRIEIEVAPDAPEALVAPVLEHFIDGWLGPPPARIPRTLPGPPPGNPRCMTL